MRKSIATTIVFFVLMISFCFSQTNVLSLPAHFQKGFGPFGYAFFGVTWNTDSSALYQYTFPVLKSIPSRLKKVKQGIILFDAKQFIHQNGLAGKISTDVLAKFKKDVKWKDDPAKMTDREIKCFVSLISGENEKGQLVCMIDMNNNLDLSDDYIFIPASQNDPQKKLLSSIRSIPYERKQGNNVVADSAAILVVSMNKNALGFTMAEYVKASFTVNNKKQTLLVSSNLMLARDFRRTQMFVWADSMRTKVPDIETAYCDSDFVEIGKTLFRYDGLDLQSQRVKLEKVHRQDYFAPQTGFFAPPFSGTDVLKASNISLAAFRGKYLFIDFWGTWCAPCRKQLPDLKKSYAEIDKDEVEFLGIATSDQLAELKDFLKKEKIEWPQILSDATAAAYKISSYPTNFLLDPKGKIIAKGLEMKDLVKNIQKIIHK